MSDDSSDEAEDMHSRAPLKPSTLPPAGTKEADIQPGSMGTFPKLLPEADMTISLSLEELKLDAGDPEDTPQQSSHVPPPPSTPHIQALPSTSTARRPPQPSKIRLVKRRIGSDSDSDSDAIVNERVEENGLHDPTNVAATSRNQLEVDTDHIDVPAELDSDPPTKVRTPSRNSTPPPFENSRESSPLATQRSDDGIQPRRASVVTPVKRNSRPLFLETDSESEDTPEDDNKDKLSEIRTDTAPSVPTFSPPSPSSSAVRSTLKPQNSSSSSKVRLVKRRVESESEAESEPDLEIEPIAPRRDLPPDAHGSYIGDSTNLRAPPLEIPRNRLNPRLRVVGRRIESDSDSDSDAESSTDRISTSNGGVAPRRDLGVPTISVSAQEVELLLTTSVSRDSNITSRPAFGAISADTDSDSNDHEAAGSPSAILHL